MNDKHIEGDSNQELHREPYKSNKEDLSLYDVYHIYQRDIPDSKNGWFSSLCQFLKDRPNSTVIVIAAIMALAYVAVVFVKNGDGNYAKLIGGITLGIMIFTLGLLALLEIRWPNGTNTEKKQRGSVESGPGHGSKGPNGDTERPDERGKSD